MEDILVYDDIFSKEEVEKMRGLLLYESPFVYGTADNPNQPPTGMIYEFTKPETLLDIQLHGLANFLISKIFEKNDKIKNKKINTIRTNLFIPGENPYFHPDGDEFITCIYYMNPYYDPDEGGETQFLIGGEIKGILPKPGRLVIFDGSIIHRATSFRTQPRLTIAITFYK
jgi:hypothetical protein